MSTKVKEPTTLADCFVRPGQATKWKVGTGQAPVDGNGTPVAQARFSIADLRLLIDALDIYDGSTYDDEAVDAIFDRVVDMAEWLEERVTSKAVVEHPSHRLEADDDGDGD